MKYTTPQEAKNIEHNAKTIAGIRQGTVSAFIARCLARGLCTRPGMTVDIAKSATK